jgi:hypothetical protein
VTKLSIFSNSLEFSERLSTSIISSIFYSIFFEKEYLKQTKQKKLKEIKLKKKTKYLLLI